MIISKSDTFSHPRLLWSLCFVVILFISTLVLVKVDTDTWQLEFLAITLVIIVLINIFTAIVQGGLFGLAGCFPSKYMNAVLGGQVCCPLFVSMLMNPFPHRVSVVSLLPPSTFSSSPLEAMLSLQLSTASSCQSSSSPALSLHCFLSPRQSSTATSSKMPRHHLQICQRPLLLLV